MTRLKCTLFAMLGCLYAAKATNFRRQAGDSNFSWAKLEPGTTDSLPWVPCYGIFECSRLQVPLNYSEPDGAKTAIAVIRVPTTVSRTSDEYLGPILFNPGGPGGSGVAFLKGSGAYFANTVLERRFDIVSFDPRGIGLSTPHASLFSTPVERELWLASIRTMVTVEDDTRDGVGRALAYMRVTNQLAGRRDGSLGLLKHINTENVARDMLEITKVHGDKLVKFWGFSYGSILGSTFATLFPDKFDRLVIDGVMEADDYYSTGWSTNVADADKTWQLFFTSCFEAGPTTCAFHANSPKLIAQRYAALEKKIGREPVAVVTPTSYGIINKSKLRADIFSMLYSPYILFPPLARGLAALENGDGSVFWSILSAPKPSVQCGEDEEEAIHDSDQEGLLATACTDGKPTPGTMEDAKAHLEALKKTSTWYDVIGWLRLYCTDWPNIPREHFQGPVGGNTTHPMLVVGNTADPATPLRSAKKTASLFSNSVLLTQDTPGHSSINGLSTCTTVAIREYFVNGTVPSPGTICPSDIALSQMYGLVLSATNTTTPVLQRRDSDGLNLRDMMDMSHLFVRRH